MLKHHGKILFALAVVIAAGVIGLTASRPAFAQAQKVRVNLIPAGEVAPMYAAIKNGDFAAEGLEVDTTPSVGGAAGIPGLVGGAYDVIYGNIVSTLLARQQGLDIKIIAAASKGGVQQETIMVRKADGIKSGADLAGKTIAVNTRNGVIWLYARAWIKATGGDPDKVTFKEVPFPQMLDALKRKQVDAAFIIEPFVTAAKSDPDVVGIGRPYQLQPDLQVGQYLASSDFIKKNPEIIERFVRALKKGNAWVDARLGTPEVAELVTSFTKIPVELTKQLTLAHPTTKVNLDEVKKAMGFMREHGLLKSDIDPTTVVYKTAAE